MALRYVSVFMDVEDPINPLADDAARDLATLFSEVGIRGSFCVTGDKCRVLKDCGREDVAHALRSHCLGLHTNGHSRHPTTMELLADLPFDEGCKAAYAEERKGFDAFDELFGRPPIFWGGAGNTWSPEITDALKELGIGAYAYALTSLPGNPVHRFSGVYALPQTLAVSEDSWADEADVVDRTLAKVEEFEGPWMGLFVGHPTRFRHVDYWDKPYFAGRTPPTPEPTEPQPVERYERAKASLQAFLKRLKGAATVVGIDEVLALPWTFRAPDAGELAYFRDQTEREIRSAAHWPPHRPNLNPDRIVAKTLDLANTLQVATPPGP